MIVYHIPYLDAKDLNQIMLRFSKKERPVKVIRTDTGIQIFVIGDRSQFARGVILSD